MYFSFKVHQKWLSEHTEFKNRIQITKNLIDAGVNINANLDGTALHKAIDSINPKVANLLINHPKINCGLLDRDGNSTLQRALRTCYTDIDVNTLISKTPELNDCSKTLPPPLVMACALDEQAIVKTLLESKAHANIFFDREDDFHHHLYLHFLTQKV